MPTQQTDRETVPTQEQVKAILTLPVKCDEYGMYIFDSAKNMVADTNDDSAPLQVRGWGRLKYLANGEGERIQKTIGDAFAYALNFVYGRGLEQALSRAKWEGRLAGLEWSQNSCEMDNYSSIGIEEEITEARQKLSEMDAK
jgi:hypothetical protein